MIISAIVKAAISTNEGVRITPIVLEIDIESKHSNHKSKYGNEPL